MILITTFSCSSMIIETNTYRMVSEPALQITEYVFVVSMAIELSLKTMADGLMFTPESPAAGRHWLHGPVHLLDQPDLPDLDAAGD